MKKIKNPSSNIQKNINLLIGLYNEIYHISDECYLDKTQAGSVAKHLRHILNFYENFFEAYLKKSTVNFQNRESNPDIESDREGGLGAISDMIKKISSLDTSIVSENYLLVSDGDDVDRLRVRKILRDIMSHTDHHCWIIRVAIVLFYEGDPLFCIQDTFFGYEEFTIKKLKTKN